MNKKLLLILLLILQVTQIDAQSSAHRSFLEWKQQHTKNYVDQTEQLYRFYIYNQNVQQIKQHNSRADRTYEQGVNQFSDLTWEEFETTYLSVLPPVPDDDDYEVPSTNLRQDKDQDGDDFPFVGACSDSLATFNYSAINATNQYPAPVKNQGQCGSCYAFAALSAMSGVASLVKKANIQFSQQEIVDCSTSNKGCNGGSMVFVYNYAKVSFIANDTVYPYNAVKGACRKTGNFSASLNGPYKLRGYNTTKKRDCNALVVQLKYSPTTVALTANKNFQNYKTGIYSDATCTGTVNHAVLLVGITQCGNYIIQNSYGTFWGERGFIRMRSGNTCRICENGGVTPIY